MSVNNCPMCAAYRQERKVTTELIDDIEMFADEGHLMAIQNRIREYRAWNSAPQCLCRKSAGHDFCPKCSD